MPKSVKFWSLGCKVNQYETQAMREQFLRAGFQEFARAKPAQVYVINTCTVTQQADNQSFQLLRRARRENPRARIVVTGCLTELDAGKIKQAARNLLLVRNSEKENILGLLNNPITQKPNNSITTVGISYFKEHTRAFLKIQDGCNNRCAFCKVRLVRGSSRSRPLEGILAEAERLAENGYKEIVLCGICLGAYGRDLRPELSLAEVIAGLEKIKGLWRIRLSSLELADISEGLIDKLVKSKMLCRHLHIPLQSGDSEILKRMKRSYSAKEYLALIRRLKRSIPGIAVTTDVLVGFPGEKEEQFMNTLALVRKIMPLRVHIFGYSARQGTLAGQQFEQRVDSRVVSRRIALLRQAALSCSLAYRRKFLGRELEVLVEAVSKQRPDFWEGYTDNYIKVLIRSSLNLANCLVMVRIKEVTNDVCLGEVLR